MTKKRFSALFIALLMLLTVALPASASATEPVAAAADAGMVLHTDGDLIYAVSEEDLSPNRALTSVMPAFGAGAIDANGTLRSQLSAQGKLFFDKLNAINIQAIKSAGKDGDGFNIVKFDISDITGMEFEGVTQDGKFYISDKDYAKYNTLWRDMDMAITAFRYDRADSIWATTMKLGLYTSTTDTTLKITAQMFGFYLHYNGKEEGMWNEMMGNANVIVKTIKDTNSGKGTDRYRQVQFAHNLLAEVNEYSSFITDSAEHLSHLAYSGLVPTYGDEPVCDGYSKAFKIIMDKLGIPCVTPVSHRGNHMWNNVKMEDGKWYIVDVTWDDRGSAKQDYFLIGTGTLVNGQPFSSDTTHTEENPYIPEGEAASDATTFVYPAKSTVAYVYSGTSPAVTDAEFAATAALILEIPPFPDVYKDRWYYDYVKSAKAAGVFTGSDTGLFNPVNPITRAEFAQALANYMKFDKTKYTSNPFTDVSNTGWASPAIAWANEQGYVVAA